MRRPFIQVLTAALWLFSSTVAPSFAAPAFDAGGALRPAADRGALILVQDEDDRDIVRLLPPGGGPADPQGPDIPFPPHGGPVPGSGLRLSGRSVDVPVQFQPWPGHETLGYIGVQLDGVNDPNLASALGLDRESGVFVVTATPGGPAAAAGLRFGDFVTALDGTPILQTNDLVEVIKTRSPGSQGTFKVWRVADDGAGYLQALRDLGDRGSTPAMLFLARLYTNGTGVQRNATEAVAWYKKAALAGSTNGMLLYGDALAAGNPIKDLTEAERWIRKAAEAGNVAAIYRLGRMYRDGEGMRRDPLEAVNLFKKAAEGNYTPAMVAVGLMFEGGGGLEADPLQAVQWYKKAAEAGDADGMAALGTMYSSGRGVETNYATAAAWYGEAAKYGQLLAVHNLAVLYDKGLGVGGRNPQAAADYVYYALERRYQFTYQQMMQNSRAWTRDFRKALQQRLARGGHYSGSIDGAFGRTTYDAINSLVQAR